MMSNRAIRLRSALRMAWLAPLLLLPACMFADEAAADDAGTGAPSVVITLVSSATPEVGDTVEISASLRYTSYLARSYSWTVRDPQNGVVKVTTLDSTGSRASFEAAMAGSYDVSCSAALEGTGWQVQGSITVQVEDPTVKKLVYTARILPPSSSDLPPTDIQVTVGAADQSNLTWAVDAGRQVSISVSDGSAPVTSYLRLLRAGGNPAPRDLFLTAGEGKVRLSGVFHALFIPTSAPLAPLLKPYTDASRLSSNWAVTVDPGVQVQGTVSSSAGPLSGARVTLKTTQAQVLVPSTVASVSAAGAFSLRTRSGPAIFTVAPPAGSGLPLAEVRDPKLQVTGSASGWSFSYASALASVKLGGKITGSDGKPAAGATVVLTGSAATVGTLKVPGGGSYGATGHVRQALVSDAAGALQDPLTAASQVLLPAGAYVVETWPGPGAPAGEGYSRGTLTLFGTPAPLVLSLARRARVSGTVLGPEGKPVKARITASGTVGSRVTFNTLSDGKGAFSLSLDNFSTYSLVVRAVGSEASLASYLRPAFSIPASGSIPPVSLPRAVTLSGQVTTSGGAALKDALLRIWCSDADCNSEQVLDQVRTRSDGTFELRVPRSESK
jgi:hypothetical protein